MPIQTRNQKRKLNNNDTTDNNDNNDNDNNDNTDNIQYDLHEMPDEIRCKNPFGYCTMGQSCIVDRRWLGDFVHEDLVFDACNIPRRKNCYESFTFEQQQAMNRELSGFTPLHI